MTEHLVHLTPPGGYNNELLTSNRQYMVLSELIYGWLKYILFKTGHVVKLTIYTAAK